MDQEWIGVIAIVIAIVGANYKTQKDIGGLRERMATLEGKVDTLIAAFVKS